MRLPPWLRPPGSSFRGAHGLVKYRMARPVSGAESIETRASWLVAFAALGILSVAYGAPLVAMVALKPIAADLGTPRSVAALAGSLVWLGSGLGGIAMGWIADRIGVRWTVLFGAVMSGAGLTVSAAGGIWPLLVGHGLLVGLLGSAGMFAPLLIYVSRWFDRRRGTALALIGSGQYIAGTIWPALIERGIATIGWRRTMVLFGLFEIAAVVPAAALLLRRVAPEGLRDAGGTLGPRPGTPVLGLPPNTALALLSLAGFLCCVPMAIPAGHLVAFCGDLGIPPARGAAMLSLLLGAAFVSRQFWGWVADRIGGLRTILAASACQAAAMSGFLLTQDEIGLFTVSAAFGLGFSGIIPAYVLAVRELFPAREAGWRVPTLLFLSMVGMAVGSWMAGALYDRFGFYAPAFAAGIAANLANLAVVGSLVALQRSAQVRPALG
jgi:MFS family permease